MNPQKANIEYNVVGDGRKFLNYWDFMNGKDVACEVKEGKLLLMEWDEQTQDFSIGREISIGEYLQMVEDRK